VPGVIDGLAAAEDPAMLTVPPEDGDPLGAPFEREQSILAETLLDLQVRPARPGMLSRARAGRR
jgi:hypothetical protein